MKKHLTTIALLAVLARASTLAQAAPAVQDLKPGLWELTDKVSSQNGQVQAAMSEMQRQLANMTLEQRQSLQQMLERNGVQFDLGAGGALRTRVCMTREMIARQELPMQEGDCSYKMTPAGTGRLKVAFSCTRPPASGAGEMTVDSPTSYRARVQIHKQDQPEQSVDMDVDGRWLAADCGQVRPIALPPRK